MAVLIGESSIPVPPVAHIVKFFAVPDPVTVPLPVPAPISERTCAPVLYSTTPLLETKNLSVSELAFDIEPICSSS